MSETNWKKVAKGLPTRTPAERLYVFRLHNMAFSGSKMKCCCKICKEHRKKSKEAA